MKIDGKIAVVVGGARGIGRAYCEALLAKGAKVVMADIENDLGACTAMELCQKYGEGKALFHHCDNTREEDVKDLFKKAVDNFGIPDIFVHNPAIMDEFQWEKTLAVNLSGLIRCCNEALQLMSKANGGPGGVIVNTASIGGLRPVAWAPVYAATKYAGVGYTLSWGQPENLAVTGVRFNCICPTAVNTEFYRFVSPEFIYHTETTENASQSDTLQPEYVAQGLIKLIEDDSVSGKALRVTKTLGFDFAEFQDTPDQ